MTAVLLDRERDLADVDLLDDPWREGRGREQIMAAARAEVEAMVEGAAVDGLGRESGAFVLGMAGLAADAASVLAFGRWRLGRLDDVGGRGLGGGRGVLASRGELLGQLGDDLLEGGEFRLQGIDSRLEPKTIGAGSRVRDTHGDRSYTLDGSGTTTVNGHRIPVTTSASPTRSWPTTMAKATSTPRPGAPSFGSFDIIGDGSSLEQLWTNSQTGQYPPANLPLALAEFLGRPDPDRRLAGHPIRRDLHRH